MVERIHLNLFDDLNQKGSSSNGSKASWKDNLERLQAPRCLISNNLFLISALFAIIAG